MAVNLAIPPSETPLLLHTMPFNRADSQETSYCSLRNTTPLTPCSPVDSDRPLSWNGDPFDELVFPDGAPCTPMVQSNGGRAQEPVSPVICEPFPTPYYRPEVQSNGGCAEEPSVDRVDALRTYVCEVNDLTGDDPVVDLTREGIDLTGDDGETIPATPTVSGPPGSLRAQKRPLCPHASRQEWGWTPEPSPGDCDPSVGASSKKAKRD